MSLNFLTFKFGQELSIGNAQFNILDIKNWKIKFQNFKLKSVHMLSKEQYKTHVEYQIT